MEYYQSSPHKSLNEGNEEEVEEAEEGEGLPCTTNEITDFNLTQLGFMHDHNTGILSYVCQKKDFKIITKTVTLFCISGKIFVQVDLQYHNKKGQPTNKDHQTIHLNAPTLTEVIMAISLFSQ